MLHLTAYQSPEMFLAHVQGPLGRREASNNLILGLADTLIRMPNRFKTWHLVV